MVFLIYIYIYISDIVGGVHSIMLPCAVDDTLCRTILTPQDCMRLNKDLTINDDIMNGEKIPRTDNHDYIGVIFSLRDMIEVYAYKTLTGTAPSVPGRVYYSSATYRIHEVRV